MTTTTTAAWNPNILQMIRQALLNCGAIDENDPLVPGPMYDAALFQANGMVKAWQATGLHVWKEQEAILFVQLNQPKYEIGGDVDTNVTASDDWVATELAVNAYTGDTTLTVDDDFDIENGDYLGIVLDDNSTFWTTVSRAPASNVVTFDDALTGDAGSGNLVLAYTTKIQRPLRIPSARLLQFLNLNETQMTIMSRQEYMDQPNKYQQGIPTQWFYSPQLVSGLLYVWPAPSNANYAVRFTWYQSIFDFDDPANTADFPQEWANALIWNLAKEMAPGYGVSDAQWTRIKEMAAYWMDMAESYDRESEPIQFGIDTWASGYR